MASPSTDQINKGTSGSEYSGQGINSPELNPDASKPTPRVRSLVDATQAAELFRVLENENSPRNDKNARITAKYNAEKPYRYKDLQTENLSWKANFSTKILSTLIDKVAPRFTRVVNGVKSLTSSSLPEEAPNAPFKSERFQREVTKTIRAWPGWKNFIAQVCQENALFGYTSAAITSEYTWRPKHFRQDNFFVPVGTKQNAGCSQVVCLREPILPHELFEMVRETSAATDAGWHVSNTLCSINSAMPEGMRSVSHDTSRLHEDLARGSNVGASYLGAKVVVLGHVFAQEVDGKVSHYIVDTRTNQELFTRFDRFDSMADVAVFFSFQEADGNLHSSKGIGREVYNMAGVLDRARNEVVDRLQLAGKVIIQADEKLLPRFRLHMSGPAMLIGSNYQVQQHTIDGNVAPFFELDRYMTALLDQIAGNVSPKSLDQAGEGMRSPAAWNVVAAREEEQRDAIIERFLDQFSVLVTLMQRRMCDSKCQDDDAKDMRKRLLLHMSSEELEQLANTPSAEVVHDLTGAKQQQVIVIATENRGNPLYNQRELEKRKLTAQMGEDFAEAVLLPINDPTEEAEQARSQQLEILALEKAQPVPTSPRDNHIVHMQVLQPYIEAQLQVLAQNPTARPSIEASLDHMQQHIASAVKTGDPAQNPAEFAAFVTEIRRRLATLDRHDQAAQAAGQAGLPPEMALEAGRMGAQAGQVPPTEGGL